MHIAPHKLDARKVLRCYNIALLYARQAIAYSCSGRLCSALLLSVSYIPVSESVAKIPFTTGLYASTVSGVFSK